MAPPGVRVPFTVSEGAERSASCDGETPDVPVPVLGNWLLCTSIWLNVPSSLYWYTDPARAGG